MEKLISKQTDTSEKINALIDRKLIQKTELAKMIGLSYVAFMYKLRDSTWSLHELKKIDQVLDSL